RPTAHHSSHTRRSSDLTLAEGQGQLQRGAYREAARTLERGKARAEGLPGAGALVEAIDAQLQKARRALAAEDLHAVAERLRYLRSEEHSSELQSRGHLV